MAIEPHIRKGIAPEINFISDLKEQQYNAWHPAV